MQRIEQKLEDVPKPLQWRNIVWAIVLGCLAAAGIIALCCPRGVIVLSGRQFWDLVSDNRTEAEKKSAREGEARNARLKATGGTTVLKNAIWLRIESMEAQIVVAQQPDPTFAESLPGWFTVKESTFDRLQEDLAKVPKLHLTLDGSEKEFASAVAYIAEVSTRGPQHTRWVLTYDPRKPTKDPGLMK